MNNQIIKQRLEKIQQLFSNKIEEINTEKVKQELYNKGQIEKKNDTDYNSYSEQLDRLVLNISTSSFFMALIIGMNAFIIYRFHYLDGIWIPCLIVIGYFFYLGKKRSKEEKLKCLNHYKKLEERESVFYDLIVKAKMEITEINKTLDVPE